MKYFNIKRYKFSTILKNINFKRYNFSKVFKFIDLKSINFNKFYKYLDIRRLSKYLDIRKLEFHKNYKKTFLKYYKNLSLYFLISLLIVGFVYLVTPAFYNYDKSKIEKVICKNKNIKCQIKGNVNYSFYPTPRIKIKELKINDSVGKNNILTAEKVAVKLSIKNLLFKEKHNFKKIELNNFIININLKNLNKYSNIFKKETNFIPIIFNEGKIIFLDEKNYIAAINNSNLNLIFKENTKKAVLKGKFLNDNIYVNLSSKKTDNKPSTDLLLKISKLNLLIKSKFPTFESYKNISNANVLIKQNKHRLAGIFDYKNNEIIVNNLNLKSVLFNGKLEGKIKILPYFKFDLDLSLNNINLTKLYNYFLNLDENIQKNYFKINNKINGKLNLSSDKVYSKYNLVKSFESRIKLNNGNISVDQFLLNLGKLGAADISGTINNDKKFTNFKYEGNLFVDNKKKFKNKFNLYNKESVSSHLFISGNFDFQNIKSTFYEIHGDDKMNEEDINFIEKEFNNIMLEDGYNNLFRFPKFTEFLKTVTSETN